MTKVMWVLVSTTSQKEAEKIGKAVLKEHHAACFGTYPRTKSMYFWPPKSSRLEESKGPLLVLETFPRNFNKISKLVRKLHSDKVPFIGSIAIDNVAKDFAGWMSGEVI